MFLVGLTGGVATGKSTVSGMFAEMGVPIIDADLMARRVLSPGRKGAALVAREFPGVFDPETGELDRGKLRQIIFEDEKERKKLDSITHPLIYKEIVYESLKCALGGHPFIILDLPLLFEAGVMVGYMHKIIVVTCEEDLQLQRLMEQRRLSERDSKLMINAQMPLFQKEKKADFVIENSGSMADTLAQVKEIHRRHLSRSNFHWKIRFFIGTAVTGVIGVLFILGKKILSSIGGPASSMINKSSKNALNYVNKMEPTWTARTSVTSDTPSFKRIH